MKLPLLSLSLCSSLLSLSVVRFCVVAGATLALSAPARADVPVADAPSTTEQVKAFFPKTKGPELPPYAGGVKFGMSKEESAKVLPEPFLKGPMRHTPEAFPALQVGADRSSGGFFELRVHVTDVDMVKLLRQQWGKPTTTQKGMMTTKYFWTNAKAGVRAILEGSFGQKNVWTLVLRQYADDVALFQTGKRKKTTLSLPLLVAEASIGQEEDAFKTLVPAFANSTYIEPPGHAGLRIDYFTWPNEDPRRIRAFSVTSERDPTTMLKKLWGKPKTDGNGRKYWRNKKIVVADQHGEQSKGIRATVVKRYGTYSLHYAADARGDYTPD